jgi:hypothetical protein
VNPKIQATLPKGFKLFAEIEPLRNNAEMKKICELCRKPYMLSYFLFLKAKE